MAQKQRKAQKRKKQEKGGSVVLGVRNVILLTVGLIIIIVGYFLLGKGSITAAPILLVLGYCVVVPLSIILWVKRPQDKTESNTGE